jgi:Tfp pilus assembly protein PilF
MNLRRFVLAVPLALLGALVPSALADIYPVILHGKVVMEDGSPPPVIVSLERVCSDRQGSMPGVLTDKKGEYIWRMNIDPLETRDCTIRASHTGYTSTRVQVSGVDTTHTTLDLPPIVIRPAGGDPYVLNFSDNNITMRAHGDWKAALKALDDQNLSEVAKRLEAVTEASPKAGQAWHGLGVVDEKLDKLSDARAAYEHAIAAEPKMLTPYVTLTRLCIKTKDWNCAEKTSEALIKVDSKHLYSEIYLHQAVARYQLKDLSGAEESAHEAIDKAKIPRAEYVLGRILEAKGDVAGAKEHFAKYLEMEPAPQDVVQVKAHIEGLGKQGGVPDPELEVL